MPRFQSEGMDLLGINGWTHDGKMIRRRCILLRGHVPYDIGKSEDLKEP